MTTATATYPAITRAEASILRRAAATLKDIENRAGRRSLDADANGPGLGRLAAVAAVTSDNVFDVLIVAKVYADSPQAAAAVDTYLARNR